MMRVFWEEWRSAHAFASFRVLPGLAVGAALALLITAFHPGALVLAWGVAAFAGGTLSGTQRWSHLPARDWVALERVTSLAYAGGKTTGFLAVLAVWGLFLAPPLVLTGWTWALPLSALGASLAWVVAGALAAQAASQALCWADSAFARVIATVLLFLWFTVTFQLAGWQNFNPLWQLWHQFHDPEAAFAMGAWSGVVGFTALLWGVILLTLRTVEARG